jgi:hypothetical protein
MGLADYQNACYLLYRQQLVRLIHVTSLMLVEILLVECMGVTKRQWAATMRASYTMAELGRKGEKRPCQLFLLIGIKAAHGRAGTLEPH